MKKPNDLDDIELDTPTMILAGLGCLAALGGLVGFVFYMLQILEWAK